MPYPFKWYCRVAACIAILLAFSSILSAQVNSKDSAAISTKYIRSISDKASSAQSYLEGKSNKVLARFLSQEEKLRAKLSKIDSAKAANVFSSLNGQYEKLLQRLSSPQLLSRYVPSIDSFSTSLKFLQQNPSFLKSATDLRGKVTTALDNLKGLDNELAKAEEIKRFLTERKRILTSQLENYNFSKDLVKLNKQVYYYSEQVTELKRTLRDKKRIERKALELLAGTSAFKKFMRKNSQLAAMFRLPAGNNSSPVSNQGTQVATNTALQTRAQVDAFMNGQLPVSPVAATGAASGQGNNVVNPIQKSITQVQSQLTGLRESAGSSDANDSGNMPEGFTPNPQHSKSFMRRLETGIDWQTQRASYFFPVQASVALSVGYKINSKSTAGIGVSYIAGLGTGWKNIRVSHQGIGLRSYVDLKIKGSFWLSGGYERNYRAAFRKIEELKNVDAWQQSGLIGLSKVIQTKSNFSKQVKLQLLWDFLSYSQKPSPQPLVFRVKYNF